MDFLTQLAGGFAVVFKLVPIDILPGAGTLIIPLPVNILLCLLGTLIGTLIGVLPGVGPIATIAMLLPITYKLDPTGALIMLAGIYYGAQYGGSTTAILVNMPGEATSVVTTLDGHQMAKQGRGGRALAIAAIGSFIAGSFATLLIAALAKPLSAWALQFWQADYVSLMIMGLVFAVALARGSVLKALVMISLGLVLASVGTDVDSVDTRLTFGFVELSDGIEFAALAMGAVGFAEILRNVENPESAMSCKAKSRACSRRLKTCASQRARSHAARSSAPSSAFCQGTVPCLVRLRPTRSKSGLPKTRRASVMVRSRASPVQSRPIMPARRPPLSPC